MKTLFASILILLIFPGASCGNNKSAANCYKARLEIKGICMNYTLSVIGGNIDPSLIEASWTDENTGISYKNAFRLGTPCGFPSDLKAGDEFYFEIMKEPIEECIVCEAFYPTPAKAIPIRVLNQPCP
jgi:hypothetical protein